MNALRVPRPLFVAPRAAATDAQTPVDRAPASPDAFAAAAPSPTSNATPHLTYYGGNVLTAPVVSNIYLGDYWKGAQGTKDVAHNDAFTQDLGHSSLASVWAQYGGGAPTFGGSTIVPGASPARVFDKDIQGIVKNAVDSGAVKPNAQGIYNVVLPPGTVFDAGDKNPDGSEDDSLHGLSGEHFSFAGPDGKPIYYSVAVYDQGNNGVVQVGNPQDDLTVTESHEIAETITDPDVDSTLPGRGDAWYDFDTMPGSTDQWGEIGDIGDSGNHGWGQVDGFWMQMLWSNVDGQSELAAQNPGPVQPLPPPSPKPAGQ